MTIGDDGIASICMDKEHKGDPCCRCGHMSDSLYLEKRAKEALLLAIELVGSKRVKEMIEEGPAFFYENE